jgi:hypothetical protein
VRVLSTAVVSQWLRTPLANITAVLGMERPTRSTERARLLGISRPCRVRRGACAFLKPSPPAPGGCTLGTRRCCHQLCRPHNAPSPANTHREQHSTTAAMFRDFSFAPASSPSMAAYEAERAAMNVSPTSKPDSREHYHARPPTPPCTIGDLASKLNQQSLRLDTSVGSCYSGPLTPPSDDDDAAIGPVHAAPRPTYSRVSASLLRMQRQSNSRMQCCSSHVRDISRLVHMIEEEEQCTISEASSRTSSTSTSSSSCASGDDEGIDMEYEEAQPAIEALVGMPQWKAGDVRDHCTRVAKSVRMRKRSGHKVEKRRSS